MNLKTYFKLLFHVIVTVMIIMLPVSIVCILLYNILPDWAVVVLGVLSGLISIFPALKYMIFIVNKGDLFKDMF